jgi:3,4-dihydroxy-2-butanone 4-phosphate synthase
MPQRVTPKQAAEIKRRRTAGESGIALAREYGISPQLVCDILKGRYIASTNRRLIQRKP